MPTCQHISRGKICGKNIKSGTTCYNHSPERMEAVRARSREQSRVISESKTEETLRSIREERIERDREEELRRDEEIRREREESWAVELELIKKKTLLDLAKEAMAHRRSYIDDDDDIELDIDQPVIIVGYYRATSKKEADDLSDYKEYYNEFLMSVDGFNDQKEGTAYFSSDPAKERVFYRCDYNKLNNFDIRQYYGGNNTVDNSKMFGISNAILGYMSLRRMVNSMISDRKRRFYSMNDDQKASLIIYLRNIGISKSSKTYKRLGEGIKIFKNGNVMNFVAKVLKIGKNDFRRNPPGLFDYEGEYMNYVNSEKIFDNVGKNIIYSASSDYIPDYPPGEFIGIDTENFSLLLHDRLRSINEEEWYIHPIYIGLYYEEDSLMEYISHKDNTPRHLSDTYYVPKETKVGRDQHIVNLPLDNIVPESSWVSERENISNCFVSMLSRYDPVFNKYPNKEKFIEQGALQSMVEEYFEGEGVFASKNDSISAIEVLDVLGHRKYQHGNGLEGLDLRFIYFNNHMYQLEGDHKFNSSVNDLNNGSIAYIRKLLPKDRDRNIERVFKMEACNFSFLAEKELFSVALLKKNRHSWESGSIQKIDMNACYYTSAMLNNASKRPFKIPVFAPWDKWVKWVDGMIVKPSSVYIIQESKKLMEYGVRKSYMHGFVIKSLEALTPVVILYVKNPSKTIDATEFTDLYDENECPMWTSKGSRHGFSHMVGCAGKRANNTKPITMFIDDYEEVLHLRKNNSVTASQCTFDCDEQYVNCFNEDYVHRKETKVKYWDIVPRKQDYSYVNRRNIASFFIDLGSYYVIKKMTDYVKQECTIYNITTDSFEFRCKEYDGWIELTGPWKEEDSTPRDKLKIQELKWLTSDMENVIKGCEKELEVTTNSINGYMGAAGTGKTYKAVTVGSYDFLTAFTNKAVDVLRNKTEELRVRSGVIMTCHNAFCIYGGDSSKYRYKRILIDEISMLNPMLWGKIIDYANNLGVRFTFAGDYNQCAPVGYKIPTEEFRKNVLRNMITLTEQKRYDSNLKILSEKVLSKKDIYVKDSCPIKTGTLYISHTNNMRCYINSVAMRNSEMHFGEGYASIGLLVMAIKKRKAAGKLPEIRKGSFYKITDQNDKSYILSARHPENPFMNSIDPKTTVISKKTIYDAFVPGYCITTFNSQGSTIECPVSIVEWNNMNNTTQYTAVTRSKNTKNLIMCKSVDGYNPKINYKPSTEIEKIDIPYFYRPVSTDELEQYHRTYFPECPLRWEMKGKGLSLMCKCVENHHMNNPLYKAYCTNQLSKLNGNPKKIARGIDSHSSKKFWKHANSKKFNKFANDYNQINSHNRPESEFKYAPVDQVKLDKDKKDIRTWLKECIMYLNRLRIQKTMDYDFIDDINDNRSAKHLLEKIHELEDILRPASNKLSADQFDMMEYFEEYEGSDDDDDMPPCPLLERDEDYLKYSTSNGYRVYDDAANARDKNYMIKNKQISELFEYVANNQHSRDYFGRPDIFKRVIHCIGSDGWFERGTTAIDNVIKYVRDYSAIIRTLRHYEKKMNKKMEEQSNIDMLNTAEESFQILEEYIYDNFTKIEFDE